MTTQYAGFTPAHYTRPRWWYTAAMPALAEISIGGYELKYLLAMVLIGVMVTVSWILFRRMFEGKKQP